MLSSCVKCVQLHTFNIRALRTNKYMHLVRSGHRQFAGELLRGCQRADRRGKLSDCRVVRTATIVVTTDEIERSTGIVRKLDQLACPAGTPSSGRASDLKISFGSTSKRVCCLFVEFKVSLLLDSRVRFVTRRSRGPEATVWFVPHLTGAQPTQLMSRPPMQDRPLQESTLQPPLFRRHTGPYLKHHLFAWVAPG